MDDAIFAKLSKKYGLPKTDIKKIYMLWAKEATRFIQSFNLMEYKDGQITDLYIPLFGKLKLNYKQAKIIQKYAIEKNKAAQHASDNNGGEISERGKTGKAGRSA